MSTRQETPTYASIATREDAQAFVTSMLDTPLARRYPDAMRRSLREDATEEWRRADGSPLPDAGDRAAGASLVLLTLNIMEGLQV
jgi:hypothetical protein